MGAIPLTPSAEAVARSPGFWRGAINRLARDPVAAAALAVIVLLVLMAIFAPELAPNDPNRGSMIRRLKPLWTPGFPLGTDELGRDMLSRLIYGARLSLLMGVVPVPVAFVIGGAIGVVAGYAGGRVNTVIMRTVDVFYAFPSVLLAVALSGTLGSGLGNALFSLTVVFVPQIARVAESVTTQVRKLDYVDSARATGASPVTIVLQQVLGNVLGPVFVFATSLVSVSMILASGLSFLGARRPAARRRVGVDAEHAAHGHLRPPARRRLARRHDPHHLRVVQPVLGRPARRHGCPLVKGVRS